MTTSTAPSDSTRRAPHMLIVTGSGRSGTSTVAGVLHRLGLHVPEPTKPADEHNPRGYYENLWVVKFHGELLNPVPIRTIDARPDAADLAADVGRDPEVRRQVSAWVSEQMGHERLVVKDPRAFWLHDVWRDACEEHGVELSYLSMLRHPLDVAKSRETAYLSELEEERRRLRVIANVAAWCNSGYLFERATRGLPRSFVRYDDLLADWREAMRPTEAQVGIPYDGDLTDPSPHPVDDFIDVKLNRSSARWEDADVPPELQELAERMWETFGRLVTDPHDSEVQADLDDAHAWYRTYHRRALGIATDTIDAAVRHVRADVRRNQGAQRRKETQRLRSEIDELRERAERAEGRLLRRRVRHTASRAVALVRRGSGVGRA